MKITTFPNPTRSHINIEWQLENTPDNVMADLEVYDASGRLMLRKLIAINEPCNENIEDFSSGIYHIFIKHEGDVYSEKFIKIE